MIRSVLAIAAGKLIRLGLTLSGRGATALPGLAAIAIDPAVVARIAGGFSQGTLCVSGTNGKTTTSRMLSDIVRAYGWRPLHNRSGSNLERGLATALIAESSWKGVPRGNVGILELDEASIPRVLLRLTPRVVVVTNLFRDQMDRYFELNALAGRIGQALATLPSTTTLVLNADDPLVAYLGNGHRGPVSYFGVDDPSMGGTVPQAISDSTRCPRCAEPLAYRRVVLAHVGDWSCPACGLTRPPRDVAATTVSLSRDSMSIQVGKMGNLTLPLPGLYNAYNALAAIAAAGAVGIPSATGAAALAQFKPAFGRLEAVAANGRVLRLVLVKNPAGFNAAISAVLETSRRPRFLAALNDRDADSRDVSWIWDADFESVAESIEHIVVTGLRAPDLALRFKYAGVSAEKIEIVPGWRASIERTLELSKEGDEIVVLTTYTAMLALREALADLGHVGRFWDD